MGARIGFLGPETPLPFPLVWVPLRCPGTPEESYVGEGRITCAKKIIKYANKMTSPHQAEGPCNGRGDGMCMSSEEFDQGVWFGSLFLLWQLQIKRGQICQKTVSTEKSFTWKKKTPCGVDFLAGSMPWKLFINNPWAVFAGKQSKACDTSWDSARLLRSMGHFWNDFWAMWTKGKTPVSKYITGLRKRTGIYLERDVFRRFALNPRAFEENKHVLAKMVKK